MNPDVEMLTKKGAVSTGFFFGHRASATARNGVPDGSDGSCIPNSIEFYAAFAQANERRDVEDSESAF